MKKVPTCTWVWVAAIALMPTATARADSTHVWEKVEIKLQAQRQYDNPYTDVKVWVDLKGPEFERRCYGFWDGGHTFRVRVLATAPGRWTWESGSDVADAGLQGVRGVQYVWSRYQANICLQSPIHFDTPAKSISTEDWNAAANAVIGQYGRPPFGTLASTNSNPSSLENWGHTDRAKWLDFHQIGNRRTHDVYEYLTAIFHAQPPVPGINGEPYYDGMEDAEPGSEKAARYCRSAMYGSVLSGGLGGHIYGAGGWKGGLWSGEVEAASEYPIWEVIRWPSADQMRHLKTFVLSEGRRYQDLVPSVERLSPNRSGASKSLDGWAYCACTGDRELLLLYFEQGCPRATLKNLPAGQTYEAIWFDPRLGSWLDADTKVVTVDLDGRLELPPLPDGKAKSDADWALKLRCRPRTADTKRESKTTRG